MTSERANKIRIGILGAADIAPGAIIRPAQVVDEAEIVAVAARDRDKADAYARQHGIPRVHDSYEALLADPDIDLVYNPTPNGLHGKWTVAAVQAGKHVLCEKPFTANADEARQVIAAINATDRTVIEAFHYRYHPTMIRAVEIARSGELGDLVSIDAAFVVSGRPRDDIRWNLALAGGSLMDLGCYPIHLVRTLVGAQPAVTSAIAVESEPGVDGAIEIQMEFPGGIGGRVRSSMIATTPGIYATLTGTKGVLELTNPLIPSQGSTITVRVGDSERTEKPTTEPSYNFQLRSVMDTLLRGVPTLTGMPDAIANMEVIDAAYRAAGMEPRQPTR